MRPASLIFPAPASGPEVCKLRTSRVRTDGCRHSESARRQTMAPCLAVGWLGAPRFASSSPKGERTVKEREPTSR